MSELPVANSTELMSPPDTLYILDEDQLENVSGGERRVSFPSPEKLAVYQEPKEHDFSLCKKSAGFVFAVIYVHISNQQRTI